MNLGQVRVTFVEWDKACSEYPPFFLRRESGPKLQSKCSFDFLNFVLTSFTKYSHNRVAPLTPFTYVVEATLMANAIKSSFCSKSSLFEDLPHHVLILGRKRLPLW